MALTSFSDYIAAQKTRVSFSKTQTATTVASQWHTLFDRTGLPGAGSLTIGNTANGLVPVAGGTGFPLLPTPSGGQLLYFGGVDYGNTVAGRLRLYDRLFHVGSISLTALATTTLASQPSYAGRLPGTLYQGTEIWLEFNAAVSATATTVTVTYTNAAGTTGRSTGATATLSGFITGRMLRLPFQAGDDGVQRIDTVVVGGTVATTGSVNVIVARPLWTNRVQLANGGGSDGVEKTLLPQIYGTSALCAMICPDGTSSGVPDIDATVVLG